MNNYLLTGEEEFVNTTLSHKKTDFSDVVEWDFSHNILSEKGLGCILNNVCNAPLVHINLNLNSNELTNGHYVVMRQLSTALGNLTTLYLTDNKFTNESFATLLEMLKLNRGLKTLSMMNCDISGDQCKDLSKTLTGTLKTRTQGLFVFVQYNEIGLHGAYHCMKFNADQKEKWIYYSTKNLGIFADYYTTEGSQKTIAKIDEHFDTPAIAAEKFNLFLCLHRSAVFVPRDIISEFAAFHACCKLPIKPAFS